MSSISAYCFGSHDDDEDAEDEERLAEKPGFHPLKSALVSYLTLFGKPWFVALLPEAAVVCLCCTQPALCCTHVCVQPEPRSACSTAHSVRRDRI